MTRAFIALAWLVCFFTAVAARADARQRDANPRKVIVDADPGIDDALAMLFALRSPALEVLGITTVFGNASIEVGTANALRLVELVGRDLPVARGAAHPLIVPGRRHPISCTGPTAWATSPHRRRHDSRLR